MPQREPLSPAEKQLIWREKLAGRSLPQIADQLGLAYETVRKWWRRARDQGQTGLLARRRGRAPSGVCSQFDPLLVERALQLKRSHPAWGPERVLVQLRLETEGQALPLPSRSRLAALFKERCPELLAKHKPRPKLLKPPPKQPTQVHQLWQLDIQEKISLANGTLLSICTIREPLSGAIIASQAFVVNTAKGWRKLSFAEVRSTLRAGFSEWGTLPDAVQTDNELGLGGSPSDPLPGELSQYLAGLGIRHQLIRPGRPTDQAQVERSHRTLDGFVCNEADHADECAFAAALERERKIYNRWYPARASDCRGRPPLVAHPELAVARREYKPEQEVELFDEQRVYELLSQHELRRKVNTSGQLSLGGLMYAVGRKLAGQQVRVQCEASSREWVLRDESGQEHARRVVKGISVEQLTGLVRQQQEQLTQPVQSPSPPVPSAA